MKNPHTPTTKSILEVLNRYLYSCKAFHPNSNFPSCNSIESLTKDSFLFRVTFSLPRNELFIKASAAISAIVDDICMLLKKQGLNTQVKDAAIETFADGSINMPIQYCCRFIASISNPDTMTFMSLCHSLADLSSHALVLAKDDTRNLVVSGSLLAEEINQVKLSKIEHAMHSAIATIKTLSLYSSILVIDAADAWCGKDFLMSSLASHDVNVSYLEIDHGFDFTEISASVTEAFKQNLPTFVIILDQKREQLSDSLRSSFSAYISGAVAQGAIEMKRRGISITCVEFCVNPRWNRQNVLSFVLSDNDEVSAKHLSTSFISNKFDARIS